MALVDSHNHMESYKHSSLNGIHDGGSNEENKVIFFNIFIYHNDFLNILE